MRQGTRQHLLQQQTHHPTRSKTTIDYTQNLKDAIASLETIAATLDQTIIAIAGPAAQWRACFPEDGLDHDTYTVTREQLVVISNAREEANSILCYLSSNPGGPVWVHPTVEEVAA